MDRIFQGKNRALIGAHRGASAYCPENTMSSFNKALEQQADMLELDVQLTSDGHAVVFHDFSLERTTNGTGFVSEHTLSDLKKLDAGTWFSEEFADEQIPALEEVLAWAKGKIVLSIELKQMEHLKEPLAKRVTDLIRSYQMEDQIQLMSFNHASLAEARKHSKHILTNVICSSRLADPVRYLKELQAQVLNVPINQLSPSLIEELHQARYYVHGSMSDDIGVWKTLQEWKIDAMDTNLPDVMIRERTIHHS
ncbi:glycerophosphodiester phosphodiesterase [Metabacillus hrfriensis]|uniref:Glycerophosphodiester phosphodiesterase family protein n=1 Tax=Metabacillus hrfriensis TaxID=3048891 RepID=A0ACD4RAU2_9BACI|nr:glycerophosphodiester phosphodiesterase family protein [Metabacillus sp. CT-WN-B3]WHZ57581.1 glycerophosphodiester phosphodiesterase family protein [Metabacillus sp. CT-WN-B3]